MEIIVKGLLSGIVLAFLIGPVFFTLIQTSIERGFKCGALVAIGISLSDASYIFMAYLGLSQIVSNDAFTVYLGYAGGLIMLGFGIYYVFIKSRKLSLFTPSQIQARSPWRYIAKGFIINGLSPMVLIFWVGTMGVATTEFGYNTPYKASIYFSTIVLTVFCTDLIKAKLADKLRSVLTPKFVRALNVGVGIALIIFAGRMILYADGVSICF